MAIDYQFRVDRSSVVDFMDEELTTGVEELVIDFMEEEEVTTHVGLVIDFVEEEEVTTHVRLVIDPLILKYFWAP